jgi:quinol monooxygenase YgiN
MSTMVIGRLAADPEKLQAVMRERKADFEAVMAGSTAAGAIHHRFAIGDGEFFFVDEWKDAESFQRFFESNTTIPELIQAVGAGRPEITIAEFIPSPDEF